MMDAPLVTTIHGHVGERVAYVASALPDGRLTLRLVGTVIQIAGVVKNPRGTGTVSETQLDVESFHPL